MMTPRSRKPVVALSTSNLCQLAHFGGWGPSGTGERHRDTTGRGVATLLSDKNSRNLARKLAMMHEGSFAEVQTESLKIPDDKKSSETVDFIADATQSLLCRSGNSCDKPTSLSVDKSSCSGESAITGTFRDYLMSRSVLTASPVDLSFSSRTGDFDTSSDREMKMILSGDTMSDSLLYCLDGNQPENMQSDTGKSQNNEEKGNFCCESGSSGVDAGDECCLLYTSPSPRD